MTQDNKNPQHYIADENKIFIHISESIKFGDEMYLSIEDSIENYSEVDMNEEDKAWLESLKKEHEMHFEGMKENRKKRK